jgi:hypothetical protein
MTDSQIIIRNPFTFVVGQCKAITGWRIGVALLCEIAKEMHMPEPWESVFRTLLAISLPRLTEAGYNWAIFGSVALRLQGVHVVPRDIDIASDSYDALRVLEDALRPHITKPLAVGCHTAYWGEASLNGINVDLMVMSNPYPGELCEWRGNKIWQHIRFVDYEGLSVPVVPL